MLRTFCRVLHCLDVLVTNQLNWKSVSSSCMTCIFQERQRLSKLLGRNTSTTRYLSFSFIMIYFNYDLNKLSDLKFSAGTVQVCSKIAFSSAYTKTLLWNSVMPWEFLHKKEKEKKLNQKRYHFCIVI